MTTPNPGRCLYCHHRIDTHDHHGCLYLRCDCDTTRQELEWKQKDALERLDKAEEAAK